MSQLSIWITSILAVIIIGVIADLLLNGSRMHKFVRGVFGIITLFIIVSPLPNLIKNGFNFDAVFDFGGGASLDQNYLDAINARKIKLLEKGVQDLLNTKGIDNAQVKIDATVEGVQIMVKTVGVDLSKSNANSSSNKYEIVINIVSEALKIEKNQVTAYG